jgi:DNA-3-methyladenine glycosylase I
MKRCEWAGEDALMISYHDTEWGVPVFDDKQSLSQASASDKKIFEFLVLESAQAGLSWKTILHKREGYRKLFAKFSPEKVSKFTLKDVERLLKDASIIRNRAKIESTINNAKKFLEVQKEFGSFSKYMWAFVGNKSIDGKRKKMSDIPAITKEAESFSNDLKKRGFKFLGPTTIYAHMQAVGMVNDHATYCFRYKEIQLKI